MVLLLTAGRSGPAGLAFVQLEFIADFEAVHVDLVGEEIMDPVDYLLAISSLSTPLSRHNTAQLFSQILLQTLEIDFASQSLAVVAI